MLRCDLDLRISVFEGSAARISELVLYVHLRARSDGPSAGPSDCLILCRDDPGGPASRNSRSAVTDQDVVRLVTLLGEAGLPERAPRVVANRSLLGAGPYLAFKARIRRQAASLTLPLQNAGFSGEDAEPLRAALLRLVELTPAGRRPAVRDVIGRLVIDRPQAAPPGRCRDAGVPRRLIGAGPPAEDACATPLFGSAGRDGRKGPMPIPPRTHLDARNASSPIARRGG
jgi:hypothetical protein